MVSDADRDNAGFAAAATRTGKPSGSTAPGTSLPELAALFLRLGTTAFGGPAAHIAMMQNEVVRRRGWMSDERFLDLLGATNLIPGPNSTEMAIHIGFARRGWSGLLVAGLAFIVPAMLFTTILGWVYVRYGTVPAATWLLYGVKPAILGVVVQAIWNLGSKIARSWPVRLAVVAVAALVALGRNELLALFATGFAFLIASRVGVRGRRGSKALSLFALLPAGIGVTGTASAASAVTLPALFGVFLKVGAVLFGSGYVLLAFLRADLVERFGWLSESQLIDSIAVGQLTPGPVFTTATFIGYVLAGTRGALVATAGIFLPAFIYVALSGPLVPRLRRSPAAGAFLDGVNVASLALMAVVTFQLGRAAIVDLPTLLLGIVAAILLMRFKINATWLVLGGAAAGWLIHALALHR
jgi:chromate transporter